MAKLPRIGLLVRYSIIVGLLCEGLYGLAHAGEPSLQLGAQYKTIRPIYIRGVYNSLSNKTLSRDTAMAALAPKRYYEKSEVAFQNEVASGTVMTIASTATKVLHFPFLVERYSVRLDPDLSRGLDTVLYLDRGMEGNLDGLNQDLFVRFE